MNIPLSPCVPENLVSRDGFSRPVPRQPAHLYTQAESGAYLRDSSRVPRRRSFMKPPYAIGSVPSLSGHAIAYRWRSLPRVRRHRASKPQGSSKRLAGHHGPINMRLSFPHLLLVSSRHVEVQTREYGEKPTLAREVHRRHGITWNLIYLSTQTSSNNV